MDKLKILFELFKDKPIAGRRFRGELTKTYKLSCKEVTELYVKIHNYQIDKYGQRLDKMVDCLTFDDLNEEIEILEEEKKIPEKLLNYYLIKLKELKEGKE